MQAEQLWVKNIETQPDWATIASDGALLIVVEDVISRYDPSSGEVTWSRDDLVLESRADVRQVRNGEIVFARVYPPAGDEGSKRKRRKPEDAGAKLA